MLKLWKHLKSHKPEKHFSQVNLITINKIQIQSIKKKKHWLSQNRIPRIDAFSSTKTSMGGLYEIVWAKMSHQSLARACDSSMSQLALYTAHKTTYKRSWTGESYSFYNTSCYYQHLTRGCRTKDTVWLLARCLNSLHQLSAMLTRVK